MSSFYRSVLATEYRRRWRNNPKFSMRSFAKHLNVDPATLSRVLKEKEHLSFKTAERIVASLNLTERKRRLFFESLARAKTISRYPASERKIQNENDAAITQDQFQTISKWYHFAILELTFVDGFKSRPSWIANALGIDVIEAKDAISRLMRLGLLKEIDGKLVKTNNHLTTTDRSKTSEGLIEFAKSMLTMAARSVDRYQFEERATFGVTMAIDPDLLPLARNMIENFTSEVLSALTSDKQKRVYHLQAALFPVQQQLSTSEGII